MKGQRWDALQMLLALILVVGIIAISIFLLGPAKDSTVDDVEMHDHWR